MGTPKRKATKTPSFSPPGDDGNHIEKVDIVNNEYEIIDAPPLPERKRGAVKGEKYPFSKLEVGKAFVIRPTADQPEPWKSCASAVNAAQRRFAEVTGQKERKNKKTGVTKTVDVLEHHRKFRIDRMKLESGEEVAVVTRTL